MGGLAVIRNTLLTIMMAAWALMPVMAADDGPSLQVIMQGLRDDLIVVTDGLLSGNLDQVITGATAIAEHPRIPPDEVQRVAADLGPEMAAFKQFDLAVHDAAVEIGAAAGEGDQDAAHAAYRRMLDGCFACHAGYKERVSAVLRQAP